MKTRRKSPSLFDAKKLLAGILLVTLIALAAQPMRAAAAPDLSLDWYATGSTGSSLTSGALTLEVAIGQSIARMPNPNLCAGFECGRVYWWRLHMPALYR